MARIPFWLARSSWSIISAIGVIGFMGTEPLASYVATQTWTNAGAGNLLTGSNWSGGATPNAADDIAIIATNPTTAGNFTLNSTMTLGKLDYSNRLARSITGSGTLSLAVSSGTPEIAVSGGDLTINTLITSSNGFVKSGAGKLSRRVARWTVATGTCDITRSDFYVSFSEPANAMVIYTPKIGPKRGSPNLNRS